MKTDHHQVVLASRLRDGRSVFLAPDGAWSGQIGDAAIARDPGHAAALLEHAREDERRNLVIDPYLVDVSLEDGRPRPVDWREQIRAHGPTVSP